MKSLDASWLLQMQIIIQKFSNVHIVIGSSNFRDCFSAVTTAGMACSEDRSSQESAYLAFFYRLTTMLYKFCVIFFTCFSNQGPYLNLQVFLPFSLLSSAWSYALVFIIIIHIWIRESYICQRYSSCHSSKQHSRIQRGQKLPGTWDCAVIIVLWQATDHGLQY